jgi:hypothetical protein
MAVAPTGVGDEVIAECFARTRAACEQAGRDPATLLL